jgi:hypothetical protein
MDRICDLRRTIGGIRQSPEIQKMHEGISATADKYGKNLTDNQFLVEGLQKIRPIMLSIIYKYNDFAVDIRYYISRILSDAYIPDRIKTIFSGIDQNIIEQCIKYFSTSRIDIVPCDMSKELEQWCVIINYYKNSYYELLRLSDEIIILIERALSS